ncbi:MAG: GyrI-like domain-containing protein [Bacteroidota bacterium]
MTVKEYEIQTDHGIRIDRVFHYIDKHLDADLSLHTVSAIALFSPFHFHRIFKYITGETLNEYVTRQRIEKAALVLLHRDKTITEIGLSHGFSSNSSFTRTFKKFYGLSPTAFKKQNPNRFSKIRQLKSKNGQAYPDHEKYICIIDNLKHWIIMNAKIEIKKMLKLDLAHVSCIGAQNLETAYHKLMQWATPLELMNEHTKMVTIYHDSYKVTAAHKVRMSACMLLNEPIEMNGEVGLTSIEAGKWIVGSFEIGLDAFERSWTGLFVWMNENGYKKADRNPFELYHNNFNEHPEKKAIVDFYIPID